MDAIVIDLLFLIVVLLVLLSCRDPSSNSNSCPTQTSYIMFFNSDGTLTYPNRHLDKEITLSDFNDNHCNMEMLRNMDITYVCTYVGRFNDNFSKYLRTPSRMHDLSKVATWKWLSKQGANVTYHDSKALLWAIVNGHLDVVKYLVSEGVDVPAMDDDAVLKAYANGHLDVVKYITDMTAHDSNGKCVRKQFPGVCDKWYEYNKDGNVINEKNGNGNEWRWNDNGNMILGDKVELTMDEIKTIYDNYIRSDGRIKFPK